MEKVRDKSVLSISEKHVVEMIKKINLIKNKKFQPTQTTVTIFAIIEGNKSSFDKFKKEKNNRFIKHRYFLVQSGSRHDSYTVQYSVQTLVCRVAKGSRNQP